MERSTEKTLVNVHQEIAFIHASMFVANRLLNKILETRTYKELQNEKFAVQLKDMGNMSLDVMNELVDLLFPEMNKSTATNEAYFQYAHEVREQSLNLIKKKMFDEEFFF